MSLKIIGLNHNTAPVEIREQVVFSGDEVGQALARLKSVGVVDEAVLLSTCNRTEFYVICGDNGAADLSAWLHSDRKLGAHVSPSVFIKSGDDAIRHIFRVACGLESMVLGEPQILGQLKDAYRAAQSGNTVGPGLNRLFQHTFSVAKKVRTDTEIGNNPVSVAYAAVSLASQFFAKFTEHTALLVGAGPTIELVARHLSAKGIGRLFIANRDVDRARRLAREFSGFAVPLSELAGILPEADILISSTASSTTVIGVDQFKAAIRARRRKPVFAVDIAVPRDIDAAVGQLDDVYLYTIDDLDKVILQGQGNRELAAVDANRILDAEIGRYLSIERAKQAVPVIAALREHAETLRAEIIDAASRRLAGGATAEDVIAYATAALMKKLLHDPTVKLREAGEANDDALIEAARKLFRLSND